MRILFLLIILNFSLWARAELNEYERNERERTLRELRDPPMPAKNAGIVEQMNPGFQSKLISRPATVIGDSKIPVVYQARYENSVFLNLVCDDGGPLPVRVPYKFKEVTISSNTKSFKGGSYQSDANGNVRFRFESKEDESGRVLKVKILKKEYEVKLGTGPYELVLPMDVCKNKI